MLINNPSLPSMMPPGTVLMYHGAGINNVAGRSLPLGLDPLDTIVDLPWGAWYVCNGNSGTPHLLNNFIRSEAVSGNTDGSDNAIAVSHQHPAGGNHQHRLITFQGNQDPFTSGSVRHLCVQGQQPNDMAYFLCKTLQEPQTGYDGVAGSHQHAAAGASGVNANMPAYFSLIFIIRIS